MSAISNCSFDDIGRAIREKRRFAVVSHARPDGDAIGSTLAMGSMLRSQGKDVIMVNADGPPENLRFLPGAMEIRKILEIPAQFEPEVVFILDSADLSRVGDDAIEWIGSGPMVINLDHHISNPGFGDLRYIDPESAATGQIVFELAQRLGIPLGADARDHLWAAISTDTGSFRYPNTSARTLEIGAELVRGGVDVGAISRELYESYPYRRVEALRELLKALQLSDDGRVASWTLTVDAAMRYGILPEDTEGLIDVMRSIQGVVVAVFFQEVEGGGLRVSCRSKDPVADVGRMCAKFGGGGHRLAAGARIPGAVAEAREKFLKTIHEGLEGRY